MNQRLIADLLAPAPIADSRSRLADTGISASITRLSECRTRVTSLPHWDLYLDAANSTGPAQLPADWVDECVPVRIPHVWEQIQPGHDGVGWYRQVLRVDDLEAGETWRLHVSAAHYRGEIFLNGRRLTRHDGGYTPFWADLTPVLREGDNELLIRVVDPPREYPVEGLQSSHPLRQTALPTYKAGWYYSFGGLWQPVHLIRTGPIWLEDAFIQPQAGLGGVRVDWYLGGDFACLEGATSLHYEICSRRSGECFAAGEASISGAQGTFEFALPGAPHWSCEDPHLLELRLSLEAGAVRDSRSWRFGLREFTTDGKRFLLNGEPIHLRGVLHQGGFPRSIVFPQDKEMALKDIRSILDAGCNLSRITLRPASPMELDLCDEMGLLVIGEPPIGWIAYDEEIDARCLSEVREMILRDRNRPSVVLWTLLNEFSDTVYSRHQDPSKLISAACALGLKLDPTRLMTGNSGRSAADVDIPNGLFGQGNQPVAIVDDHIYLRNFPSAQELRSRIIDAGIGEEGVLLISEFGTSGFPDLDRALARYTPQEQALGLEDYGQMLNYREQVVRGWVDFGLDRYFKDLTQFYYALAHDQSEMVRLEQRALRLNPRVAGYIITQGADSSSEWGGIVDLWREPKRVYPVFRELNEPRLLLLHTEGQEFKLGQAVKVSIHISNLTNDHSLCQGRVRLLHEGLEAHSWEFSGPSDWSKELATREIVLDRPGAWMLVAEGQCGATSLRDERALTCHGAPDFTGRGVLLIDGAQTPHGRGLTPNGQVLHDLGLGITRFHNQDNAPGLPVLVNLKGRDRCLQYFEQQRVLRKEVEAGRNAIFIDCDLAYLHYFFGQETPREIYGNGSYAGNMGFGLAPELFPQLGPERQLSLAYGPCYPRVLPEARQVAALGGEILSIHAMPYQFGRPDAVEWGSSLYRLRLGRGQVWVCAFRIWDALVADDPVALELLDRLIQASEA